MMTWDMPLLFLPYLHLNSMHAQHFWNSVPLHILIFSSLTSRHTSLKLFILYYTMYPNCFMLLHIHKYYIFIQSHLYFLSLCNSVALQSTESLCSGLSGKLRSVSSKQSLVSIMANKLTSIMYVSLSLNKEEGKKEKTVLRGREGKRSNH